MTATALETEVPRPAAPPRAPPPSGACDAHAHVFGPFDRFPLAVAPAYPVPDAPAARHRAMLAAIGCARGVLVQPAPYGTDNRALADALLQAGGALRGIAVLDGDVDDATLAQVHQAGVRGLRFVEMRVPGTDRRYPGSVGLDQLERLAPRLAALGWHAQVWASLAQAAGICRLHAGLGLPLVFDHLAGAAQGDEADGEDFRVVLAALASGRVWVKLSVCRYAARAEDCAGARPFHDALVAANAERLLWGTDFPFVRKGPEAPDPGGLLDLLADWVPDEALRRLILVDNPARLFGFGGLAKEEE